MRRLHDLTLLQLESHLLPPWCYFDEDIAEAESESMCAGWHCAGHVSELANGTLIRLIGRAPVLIRDDPEEGLLALSGLCRHRGMPVVVSNGANEGFYCPFHGWSYDCAGRLRRSHSNAASGGYDSIKGLIRYQIENVGGWLFCSLTPQTRRASDYFRGLIECFPTNAFSGMKPFCEPIVTPLAFNWKLLCDNAGDAYHFQGTHKHSVGRYLDAKNTRFEQGKNWHCLIIPSREEPPTRRYSYSAHVYPYSFIGTSDGYVYLEFIDIVNRAKFNHTMIIFSTPEARDIDVNTLASSMREVIGEDYAACSDLQRAYAIPQTQQQATMMATPLERGVSLWQRWWLQQMLANR